MNLRIESFLGYMVVGNAWVCIAIETADPDDGIPNSQHFESPHGFAFSHAFDWVREQSQVIV